MDDRGQLEEVEDDAADEAPLPLLAADELGDDVVDDDEAVRDSVQWLLEGQDFRVRSFESSEVFLARYDPREVACLIVDIRMDGMSGLELQDRLIERNDSALADARIRRAQAGQAEAEGEAAEKRARPLGKKAQAAEDDKSAGEGSAWGDLLKPGVAH